ncbi:MAG: hypothetical protein FJ108_18595, partial [Deltaproteobacteria bacterium]|nr:hypothetical protein [Deltaproteobacteria bacterium]
MSAPWLIAAAFSASAAALATALYRSRASDRRARARLFTTTAELERISHAFARFAPMELVERVIASGVPTSGERKEVTVLFADLFGFTPLSESVDPSVLVRIP